MELIWEPHGFTIRIPRLSSWTPWLSPKSPRASFKIHMVFTLESYGFCIGGIRTFPKYHMIFALESDGLPARNLWISYGTLIAFTQKPICFHLINQWFCNPELMLSYFHTWNHIISQMESYACLVSVFETRIFPIRNAWLSSLTQWVSWMNYMALLFESYGPSTEHNGFPKWIHCLFEIKPVGFIYEAWGSGGWTSSDEQKKRISHIEYDIQCDLHPCFALCLRFVRLPKMVMCSMLFMIAT